jgi:SAM-dependent methyltransferase
MNYQRVLLQNYHQTRTLLLDPNDKTKMEWFDFYFASIYKPYFTHLAPTASIVELGCNKGFLLATLLKNGYTNLCGVDLSPQDLVIARQLLTNVPLFEQDIFVFLDNHKEKFDCVILKALIEHIKKDSVLLLLEKIYASLKPGGIIFIDVYNSDWLFALHDRYVDFTHEVGFTQESLRQILLIYFDKVTVVPTPSPYWQMSKKDTIKHRIARKIFTVLIKWSDPEAPSCTERLLIATGKKNCK